MKISIVKYCVLALLAASSHAVHAQAISARDLGTFAVVGKDKTVTDFFYRLSGSPNHWKMEGKEPGSEWKDISCTTGCAYRPVPQAEAKSYLPPAMSQSYDIDCIKNIAQAFCRYSSIAQPNQGGHVVVALVTAPPQVILLRRVKPN